MLPKCIISTLLRVWPWSVNPNFQQRYSSSAYSFGGLMLVFGTKWKLWFPNLGKPKVNNFETFPSGSPYATLELPRCFHAVEMTTSKFRSVHELRNPAGESWGFKSVRVLFFKIQDFCRFPFSESAVVPDFPYGFLKNGISRKKILRFFWYENKMKKRIWEKNRDIFDYFLSNWKTVIQFHIF